MIKFIGIITNMLKNPNFFKQIISLFKVYGDRDIIQLLNDTVNPAAYQNALIRALNPNKLINMLGRLPKSQWQNIIEQIKEFDKETYSQMLKQFELSEDKWTLLSSSWIKKGNFKLSNKNQLTGSLTILIKQDKGKGIWYGPYTYPNVPSEIYLRMRKAISKNGSRSNPIGAGSIFWKYFLDDWLPSAIRQYTKNKLYKDFGITSGKQSKRATRIDNPELQKTLNSIKKFGKNYYRTKIAKRLNGIDSIHYANTRTQFTKNLKLELRKASTSNIIKVYEKSNSVKKWSKPIKNIKRRIK